MITHRTKIDVRYYETDKMGIVHHSNYIRYFEIARIEFMKHIGLDYAVMEESGLMSPVLSVECNFKSPCGFGDVIEVECFIKEQKGVRTFFGYNVYKEEKIIATGSTSHTFVDNEFKPQNIKKNYPDIYSRIMEAI